MSLSPVYKTHEAGSEQDRKMNPPQCSAGIGKSCCTLMLNCVALRVFSRLLCVTVLLIIGIL